MRILFIATSFYSKKKFSGGMAKFLFNIISSLKQNHEITVLIPDTYKVSMKGVDFRYYYRSDNSVSSWMLSLLSIINQFSQILILNKPDIVSNFLPNNATAILFPISKMLGIKTIMNLRGYSPMRLKYLQKILKICLNITFIFSDVIIANAISLIHKYNKNIRYLKPIYKKKPKVFLPNAIDTRYWKYVYNSEKIYDICYVANLYDANRIILKGFPFLYQSIIKINEKKKDL